MQKPLAYPAGARFVFDIHSFGSDAFQHQVAARVEHAHDVVYRYVNLRLLRLLGLLRPRLRSVLIGRRWLLPLLGRIRLQASRRALRLR